MSQTSKEWLLFELKQAQTDLYRFPEATDLLSTITIALEMLEHDLLDENKAKDLMLKADMFFIEAYWGLHASDGRKYNILLHTFRR